MKNEDLMASPLIDAVVEYCGELAADLIAKKKPRSKVFYFLNFLWLALFLFIIGAAIYNNLI